MISGFFNNTVTIQQETVGSDALKGLVPQYADKYADVPARIEDLNFGQQEKLMQLQNFSKRRVFCQLPGPIDDNRTGVVCEGKFHRLTKHDTRRAIGGLPAFDVLYLEDVVP